MQFLKKLPGKTKITSGILSVTALLILLNEKTPQLRGQAVGGGQIQGSVVDSSGAVVAGAQVEATQTESGFKRQTTSGADGGYSLPNLPVGSYAASRDP